MRVDAPRHWRSVIDELFDRAGRDPTWPTLADTASIIVHGSVTVGLADHYSDLDLQVIVPDDLYHHIYATALATGHVRPAERLVLQRSPARTSDGRRSLCAAELRSISALQATLAAELAVELWVMSHAWVIQDPHDRVATILDTATQRFTTELEMLTATELGHLYRRQRWLAIANQRPGHHASRAFLATNLVRAAMRLACLLDDSPVPYDKWLVTWAAHNTRLGAKLHEPCLHLLGQPHHNNIDTLARQIVTDAGATARHRWPNSNWTSRPHHVGPVQS